MAKIKNTTIRDFGLPGRQNAAGERFGYGVTLRAGATLEVPDWYLDALLKGGVKSRGEKGIEQDKGVRGWQRRLVGPNEKGVYTIRGPRGVGGAFESRIKTLRDETAKAREQARAESGRADAAEARVAELERKFETFSRAQDAAANAGGEESGTAEPNAEESGAEGAESEEHGTRRRRHR